MDYILWHLPYSTGLQIMHAESVYQDSPVEYVKAREVAPSASLASKFDKMRQKPEESELT